MPSFFIGCALLAVPAVQPTPVNGRVAASDAWTDLEVRRRAQHPAIVHRPPVPIEQRSVQAQASFVEPPLLFNPRSGSNVKVLSGSVQSASTTDQSDKSHIGIVFFASGDTQGIDKFSPLGVGGPANPVAVEAVQTLIPPPADFEASSTGGGSDPGTPLVGSFEPEEPRQAPVLGTPPSQATAYEPASQRRSYGWEDEGFFSSRTELVTSSDIVGLAETQDYGIRAEREGEALYVQANTVEAETLQAAAPTRALDADQGYGISMTGRSGSDLSLQTIENVDVSELTHTALGTRFVKKPAEPGFDREGSAFEGEISEQSGVSLLSSLPNARGSPPIAEIEGTSKVVHLRKLVELVGDRFAPDELARLQNSPAIDTDLPVHVLEQSGISLAAFPLIETLVEPVAVVQPSVDRSVPYARDGASTGAGESQGLSSGFAATALDPAMPSTGEMSPSISEHGGATQVVRLEKLVELVGDRFAPDELERFRNSPAIDTDLSVNVIEQSGISLALLPGTENLEAPAFTSEKMVPLKGLVELVGNRFAPDELERFQNSPAINSVVPVHVLEQSGISLASFPGTVSSVAPLASMQSSQTGGASSAPGGSRRGADEGQGIESKLAMTASAGFDSNPFLIDAQDTAAPSIRLQLAPTLSSQTQRTSVRLSGRAEHIEYLGTYDSIQNYGADLTATHLANERLEIVSGLNFSRTIPATNTLDASAVDDTSPDAPPGSTGEDITIPGQRQTQFGGNAGLTYTLSERDQLSWALTGRAQRFDADDFTESNSIGQRLEYARVLGEGLTIGASVDMSLIDFSAPANGEARIISPQIQVNAELTPRLELAGSIGVASNRIDIEGLEDTTTTLAGDISLCHRDEYSTLCVNGSRQFRPAAIGGATLQTNAAVSYSLRISERDSLRLSGTYAVSEVSSVADQAQDFDNVNATARYERRLNERLRFFVSGNYRNNARDFADSVTNYGGLIGITFDLGRSR
ncbi:MAG: hypothetical protein AAF559_07720 [Pseudomonadota bacterium]